MKKWEGINSDDVAEYDLLVCSVIRKTLNMDPTLEWINAGREGVVKALIGFDGERGAKFTTYAYVCIERSLREYWRKNKDVLRFWKRHLTFDSVRHLKYTMNYEELYEKRELMLRLYEAILKLPMDKQKILLNSLGIFGHKELSQSVIGKELGISQGMVSKIRDEAINEVAKMLNPDAEYIKWKNRSPSSAEIYAEKVLRRKRLNFVMNQTIPRLVDPATGGAFRFDVQIINYCSFPIIIIEIDDAGHRLKRRRIKDRVKDGICFGRRIPLLRVPDTCMEDFDEIVDEMLRIVTESVRPCQDLIMFGEVLRER